MRHFQFLSVLLFPCLLSCQQVKEQVSPFLTAAATAEQTGAHASPQAANILFQSSDGGNTWQDISAGLPVDLNPESFFVNQNELFLGASNGVYQRYTASKSDAWIVESSLGTSVSIAHAGQNGLIAFGRNGKMFQKGNITGIWTPVFTNFQDQLVRNVFTAKNGHVFIGCDNGIFKSEDQGKTWKHVMQQGWMISMKEADGVLLCTNERGILRSTDGGEHWDVVVSEGGVGIAVEVIKGGFAAITYNTESETRRIRISSDGGKTWQPIDAGLPPSKLIASIKQVGNYFYCGHPKGIYRSGDQGKTWELIRPTIGDKVFNLSVLGDVIYAVLMEGGC